MKSQIRNGGRKVGFERAAKPCKPDAKAGRAKAEHRCVLRVALGAERLGPASEALAQAGEDVQRDRIGHQNARRRDQRGQ